MKKSIFILFLIFVLGLPLLAGAEELSTRLKGRILLQVEANGEAWYINPDNLERYYMGRPLDAFNLMRDLGLGVSNANFDLFDGVAPARLSGKILLKVEANGEAYYVNPVDLKMHYLGRPDDAFQIMRELGLGITNSNLEKIEIKEGYGIQEQTGQDAAEESPAQDEETATSTAETVEEEVAPEETATSTAETVEEEILACEYQAEYFDDIKLSGWPRLTQTESAINYEWWTGKPVGFNYNNEFSVRWTGDCEFLAGNYRFTAVFDDAMRVYIDGELIIDNWAKNFVVITKQAELELTAGIHEVKVEYYEYKLEAVAKFSWEKID